MRPGTLTIGQSSRNLDTASASSVADITTMRRSVRARHACLARASPRSAWMLRSWNSSRTMVLKEDSRGIFLKPCRQNPFGCDEQSGIGSKPAFEANLPANLAADGPAAFVRDALRDRARRHTTRLQQDDCAIGEQCRRHACRLAGAGSAVTTTARDLRAASTMAGTKESMGRGINVGLVGVRSTTTDYRLPTNRLPRDS